MKLRDYLSGESHTYYNTENMRGYYSQSHYIFPPIPYPYPVNNDYDDDS
jgi:hypothetical protein